MEYNKNFTILGWYCHSVKKTPEEQIKEWHELGLTVMIAHSNKNDWARCRRELWFQLQSFFSVV